MTHRYCDHAVISALMTIHCCPSSCNISQDTICDLYPHTPAASPEYKRECECIVRKRNCRYHILVVVLNLLFCIVSIGVYIFCNIPRRTRTDGGHGRTDKKQRGFLQGIDTRAYCKLDRIRCLPLPRVQKSREERARRRWRRLCLCALASRSLHLDHSHLNRRR